jgi:hypothetical protein
MSSGRGEMKHERIWEIAEKFIPTCLPAQGLIRQKIVVAITRQKIVGAITEALAEQAKEPCAGCLKADALLKKIANSHTDLEGQLTDLKARLAKAERVIEDIRGGWGDAGSDDKSFEDALMEIREHCQKYDDEVADALEGREEP